MFYEPYYIENQIWTDEAGNIWQAVDSFLAAIETTDDATVDMLATATAKKLNVSYAEEVNHDRQRFNN